MPNLVRLKMKFTSETKILENAIGLTQVFSLKISACLFYLFLEARLNTSFESGCLEESARVFLRNYY